MYGHTYSSEGTCMDIHIVVRVHVWTHRVVALGVHGPSQLTAP